MRQSSRFSDATHAALWGAALGLAAISLADSGPIAPRVDTTWAATKLTQRTLLHSPGRRTHQISIQLRLSGAGSKTALKPGQAPRTALIHA